ncbi:MAG: glycine zipper 2TM domain-containing protein [Candidatus Omnitrophica bacterium]|nr:glycine zipper 2TM domain-containing protein [Candidatus Omnitrophota bacterium]
MGAVVGGLLGAAAGGAIGNKKHKTAEGVLIGGAIGALGGAAVGSQMKTQPEASKTPQEAVPVETRASSGTQVISGVDAQTKVTMKQVIYWSEQGLPSDEIIARIQKSSSVFVLTADDTSYLQKQGVSQRVIEAMQETK